MFMLNICDLKQKMTELAKIDVQIGCLRTLIELQTGGPEFVEACRILLQHYDNQRKAHDIRERMHFKQQLWRAVPKIHTALTLVEGILDEMEGIEQHKSVDEKTYYSHPLFDPFREAGGNFFSKFNVR